MLIFDRQFRLISITHLVLQKSRHLFKRSETAPLAGARDFQAKAPHGGLGWIQTSFFP